MIRVYFSENIAKTFYKIFREILHYYKTLKKTLSLF